MVRWCSKARFFDGAAQCLDVLDEEVGRGRHLQRLRRVHHVVAREAEVDEARFGPDLFRDRRQKRDDVVLHYRFDLLDALDVEGGLRPDGRDGVLRDEAGLGLRFGDRDLDFEPALELGVLVPDRRHGGAGVAGNHRGPPFAVMPRSTRTGGAGRRRAPRGAGGRAPRSGA
jgi:hypothetical protein